MTNFTCKARSGNLSLRNLNFNYLEWGNKDKPLIIMLHGFMDHAHTFDPLAEKLSENYHLIAWDARGFGKTEHIHPASYYYFFDYIFDLDLFIDHFTDQPVILLGHSMGGIISSFYSSLYPQKVKKLINLEGWFLSDSNSNESADRTKNWIDGVRSLKGFKPMKNLEEATLRLMKTDPLIDPQFALHLAEQSTIEKDSYLTWSHDPVHRTKSPYQSNHQQIKSFIEKIECPVLLVQGDQTFFELEKYEKNAELYKNAERVEIKGAGHNLHIHKPDEIREITIRFLEKD